MSDHRRSFGSSPASAWRQVVLVALWALVPVFWQLSTTAAAASGTLEVEARDALPGFHLADLPRYLAQRMAAAHLADWRFEPTTRSGLAADRVEWSFKLNPYAGGEVRTFVRPHMAEKIFGAHRLITIEARLYLNGEYQTLVEKHAIIQGGPDDPDLAAAVESVTQNLLGPTGAYRALDTGQHRGDQAR